MSDQDPQLQAFVACDGISRDAATGKTVVMGIFDRIFCRSVPAIHQTMSVYFRVRMPKATSSAELKLAFVQPSGLRQETPVTLPAVVGDNGILEGNINVQGFPISDYGTYELQLVVNGKHLGSYEITVTQPGAASNATLH